ncbi:DUF4380 domain-containing protein [Actinotalea sp.]|uniref:DUF4380 domain-containing protein n=1 Tax=Actinotalea sp. TaxID=1872145 RepID=UPI0035640AEE
MVATSEDGALVLDRGAVEVTVLPEVGGRLARVRFGGVDLLLPPGLPHGFFGDTFWPSPQARWDWPPPPVLDAGSYEVTALSAHEVTLRSAPDPSVGLVAERRITVTRDGLDLAFRLTNVWTTEQWLAPWQVTRAAREGLLVWAEGEAFTDEDRVIKHREDPPCWYRHRDLPGQFAGVSVDGALASLVVPEVGTTSKYFADARGWLAHLHRGTLVLRSFPDLTPAQAAPRQAELEIYVDLERDYIEMENQGAYGALAPGASVDYATSWRFAAADPDWPTDRLSPGLVQAIEGLRT